jgi:hypothetical protein
MEEGDLTDGVKSLNRGNVKTEEKRIWSMSKLTHLNARNEKRREAPLSVSLPARDSRGESEVARWLVSNGIETSIASGIILP